MARWRRGNATVCKTAMRGFESLSGLLDAPKLQRRRSDARVLKLVDSLDLKSSERKLVSVQVRPRAFDLFFYFC